MSGLFAQGGALNSFAEVVRGAGPWIFGPGMAYIVLWFLRERKKDAAAGKIAQSTVPSEIRIKDVSAMSAQVAYIEAAAAAERAFRDRLIEGLNEQIGDLEHDNDELRSEARMQRIEIRGLTRRCDELSTELGRLSRRPPQDPH